jgi:hypothetical protein
MVPAAFDSNPKIITASDLTQWFGNPSRPGTHYNITVSLYSGTTLLE